MRRPANVLMAACLALAVEATSILAAASAFAAPLAMSNLELRNQFVQCGYEIGNPGGLSGSTTPYVVIRDPGAFDVRGADARILMAIVYPDVATATAAHQRAHRQAEERIDERWLYNDDFGPQLLSGYGASVWRGNVALVQSSSRTLASMYFVDGQTDEARIARPELLELGFLRSGGAYGVDRDFVACLEDWQFAHQSATPVEIVPNYFPFAPW
jgi:hypothetical protein